MRSSDTTLGGGLSFLSRRYGLAANRVRAIEAVLGDGRMVRIDHDAEPDLFWAMRGGGGNFGVASSFEYAAHPVSTVFSGPPGTQSSVPSCFISMRVAPARQSIPTTC